MCRPLRGGDHSGTRRAVRTGVKGSGDRHGGFQIVSSVPSYVMLSQQLVPIIAMRKMLPRGVHLNAVGIGDKAEEPCSVGVL
jgi:hypothetical protein